MPWIEANMQWFVDDETYERIQSGEYERVGGIVRRADNKRVVKWLRIGRDVAQPQQPAAHPFFRIIAHSADLDSLTDLELIEFARFVNEHPNLAGANFYGGSRAPVTAILGKFDRLQGQGDETASAAYAHEKRQALLNIFGRTYIPNLRMQVELGYIELVMDEEREIADLRTVEQRA